ncbi:MAG: hypothetical protein AB1410_07735 [Acidobacteriota bacterium]
MQSIKKILLHISSFRISMIFLVFWSVFYFSIRFYKDSGDPDIFWHLKTGELIVKNKSIPYNDPFSFQSIQKQWIAYSWLAEIIFYLIYSQFEWLGLFYLKFAIHLLMFFIILYLCYQLSQNIYISSVLTLLIIPLILPLSVVRPTTFSFLFFTLFLFIIYQYKYFKKDNLIFLPLIMILWANIHIVFIYGLILLALFLTGEILNLLIHKQKSLDLLKFSIISFLTFITTFFNPYTYKLYMQIWEYLKIDYLKPYISEFNSPDFHNKIFLIFPLLLILNSIAIASRKLDFSNILITLFFSYLAFDMIRNIPYFAISSTIVLSSSIPKISINFKIFQKKITKLIIPFLNFIIYFALFFNIIIKLSYLDPYKIMSFQYPLRAVNFLKEQKIINPKTKVINLFNWGGFLIFSLYPQTKVSVDGRTPLYLKEYYYKLFHFEKGNLYWKEYLNDNVNQGGNLIIFPKYFPVNQLISKENEWEVIYMDEISIVFRKKI